MVLRAATGEKVSDGDLHRSEGTHLSERSVAPNWKKRKVNKEGQ